VAAHAAEPKSRLLRPVRGRAGCGDGGGDRDVGVARRAATACMRAPAQAGQVSSERGEVCGMLSYLKLSIMRSALTVLVRPAAASIRSVAGESSPSWCCDDSLQIQPIRTCVPAVMPAVLALQLLRRRAANRRRRPRHP